MNKINLPNNTSYQVKDESSPFKVFKKIPQTTQFKGVVSKDGKWLIPIGAWEVSLKAPGNYLIKHMTGFKYYSISFDTMGAQAVINVITNDEYQTEIQITDGKDPINIDFAICVTQTKRFKVVVI